MKIKLLGKNLEELKQMVKEEGLPGFAAGQIARWLYVRKARSIDEMTDHVKCAVVELSLKLEGLRRIHWCRNLLTERKNICFLSAVHTGALLTCPADLTRRLRLSKRGQWRL